MTRRFITDLGRPLHLTDEAGNVLVEIGQYGVWEADCGKPQVIDTGHDLDALQAAHGPNLQVVQMGTESQRS